MDPVIVARVITHWQLVVGSLQCQIFQCGLMFDHEDLDAIHCLNVVVNEQTFQGGIFGLSSRFTLDNL